jgi:Tachylectin
MEETFVGHEGPNKPLVAEEVALVLQRVICPIGLVPSELAKQLDSLTLLLGLHCVKGCMQSSGEEDAARAVASVVKKAVARLDQGASHVAADLLLGVSRTRGLPRKDRRKDAADALVVGEAHFRKRRELALLLEVAEEVCALEHECRREKPRAAASSAPAGSGLELQSGIRRGVPYTTPVAVDPNGTGTLDQPSEEPLPVPERGKRHRTLVALLGSLGVAALVALGVFRMTHSPRPPRTSPPTASPEATRLLATDDKLFSGGDGVIYVVTKPGALLWYRQTDPQRGGANWAPGSGKVIGQGFGGYSQVFSGGGGVSGDAGIIYAIDSEGTLFWYRYSDPAGGAGGFTNKASPRGQGTPIGRGFAGYRRVFSGGGGIPGNAGVIYAVDSQGTMFWYHYSDPAGGAGQLGQPRQVDTGWTYPTVLSGGGDGVIYAVDSGGSLVWYRHNDPAGGTVGFANQGRGKQILPG